MDKLIKNHPNEQTFRLGKMNQDHFWLHCPDGRMLLVDQDTKRILDTLANHEQSVATVAQQVHIVKEDVDYLVEMLDLDANSTFTLIDESTIEVTSQKERLKHLSNKQVFNIYTTLVISFVLSLSLGSIFTFVLTTPFQFVSGLKAQWIVAGLLTLSIIIHELGHFLAMPRSSNITINIQWTGPIPLLSITCNEAWKLSKWQRMRINLAGLIADIIICGVVAIIGLWFDQLEPWIWSFLFVQLLRMIFAIWPLLPGDGYWVLVDLFEKPNLWSNAVEQLKQWRFNLLSLYALARYLFLGFIWLLYVYILSIWIVRMFALPIKEVVIFLLHPAPLFVFLNALNQVYSASKWIIKKFAFSSKKHVN